MEWRQNAQYVALILQVPSVVKTSVEAKFLARSVDMSFRSTPASGGAESTHSVSLKLAGAVDVDGCRYDVADNNMMVVLKKAAEGAEWPALEDDAATSAAAAKGKAAPEAKASAVDVSDSSVPAAKAEGKQQFDKLLFELD